MKDKIFIDTNILVYAKFEEKDETDKNKIASEVLDALDTKPVVSVQVLNEFASVLLKHKVADEDVQQILLKNLLKDAWLFRLIWLSFGIHGR